MVERRLQISLVAAATLAAVMLGVAQDNPIVVLIGVFTGITSVVFTDIKKWLVLDRRISYIAMIAAAAISLNGFWRNTSEAQLLAIANMLVFVQIALLYQEKTLRVYSHLAVFSVLQVVVAALLHVGPSFLVLLALYVGSGSYAVMMYAMHRETLRLEGLGLKQFENAAAEKGDERWRAALGGEIICGVQTSHRTAAARVLNGGRWLQMTPMAIGVLLFACFFFLFSPRLGGRGWQPSGTVGKVGFNDQISFRDLNRLAESNEVVMRASFQNVRNGELYRLYNEPYFRGAALAEYSFGSRNPTWRVGDAINPFWTSLPRHRSPNEQSDLVRQEISLAPSSQDVLFGVAPFYQDVDLPQWVNVDAKRNMLKINPMESVEGLQLLRYSMITTGLQAGGQSQILRQFAAHPEELRKVIESEYVKFDQRLCPQIARVAAEELADQQNEGRIFQCQLLMRYLLGEQFEYTLDTSRIRSEANPDIDPVEDFFANHRKGYCGHFASALALMLRSQNIPARVVVGYKGGEFNEVGGYYVIRSRDAHAWVEAYLRPEDIAGLSDAGTRDIDPRAGAWLRLDPTPGAAASEVDKGAMAYVDQVLDYSRSLWSDYVLGATAGLDGDTVISSSSSRRRPQRTFRERVQSRVPEWLWSVLGMLPIVVILSVATWTIVRNFPSIRRWRRRRMKAKRRIVSSVEFYNRLEGIAARSQLWRREHQTPQEFAGEIAERLRSQGAENGAAAAAISSLDQIIHAFYETRFGGRPLDSLQTDEIEQALSEVSEALAAQST